MFRNEEICTMKNYNPFKMRGSWVGLTIVLTITFITSVQTDVTNAYLYFPYSLSGLIVFSILGFLIGWGIHSLVRSLK
jgi:hypothetical protein